MKSASPRCRCVQLVVAFIFALASLKAAPQAEDSSVGSGTFQRIGSTEQLTGSGYYLIACQAFDGSYYLMSNQVRQKGQSKKLVGLPISGDIPPSISAPSATAVWRLKKQSANEVALISTDGSAAVYAKQGDQTNIELSASTATYWTISNLTEGTFALQHPDSEKNFLSIYKEGQATFGNYKNYDSNRLYIYKFAEPLSDAIGEAKRPADGARVGIYAAEFLAEAEDTGGLTAAEASELQLANGSMAPDLRQSIWTCRHNGTASFTLTDEQGRYLDHQLQLSHVKAEWQVTGGKIAPVGSEEALSILVLDKEQHRFLLVDGNQPSHHLPATFVPIGTEPDSLQNGGVKILSGAWSAKRLAAILWKDVDALDLTGISLPNATKKFVNRPGDRHTIIYINESAAGQGMALGDFLIAKGESGYSLLTVSSLTDKQAIAFDRDFQVGEQMLTYTRQAAPGDGWETIVLPFQADVPKKWQAKVLSLYAEGELSFRDTEVIPSHTPAIIRRTEESGTEQVTFSAKAGNVSATQPEATVFMGTYKPITIASAEDNVYLLNADGTAFVKAAAGSRLMPFRAALNLKQSGKEKKQLRTTVVGLPNK